jgi:NSS family neurotransmitter:Na+ symporter
MHNKWSSYLSFILSIAGAAIGLGNIWMFPYVAANYGGGTFIVTYAVFLFLFGLPLMFAEIKLGNNFTSCPIQSFSKVKAKFFGFWFALVSILILGFYSVVSGASFAFFADSIINLDLTWSSFTSSLFTISFWSLSFLFGAVLIVSLGVKKGLERANFWLIPILYLSLLLIIATCSNLSGFHSALDFVFSFNFKDISLNLIAAAAGQSLFSLAVGAGCLIAYGSYLPQNSRIGMNLIPIAIMTIIVGILSTLSILTIVKTYDMGLANGPELMFLSLPIAFAKMQYGLIIAKLFFGVLVIAALTSAISFLEVLIQVCSSQFNLQRQTALYYILGFMSLFILFLCFGFYKDNLKFFNKSIFELVIFIATSILLPISALMLCYSRLYMIYLQKNFSIRYQIVCFWYAIIIPGVIIAFLSRFFMY